MRTRLCLAAIAVFVALPAPSFAAPAPKKSCNVVRDAKGDTSAVLPGDERDVQLDITSADIGSNAKYVTAVVRLAQLTDADAANPQGRTYEFDFSVGAKNFIFMASLLPGGVSSHVYISETRLEENETGGRAATGIGQATAYVDTKRKELRMTASVDVFAPHARIAKNTFLEHLAAFTYRANGYSLQSGQEVPTPVPFEFTGSGGVGADEAWGRGARYRATAPTCVPIGR